MFLAISGDLGPSTNQGSNEVANFLFEHAALVVTAFILLIAITIAVIVFLALLWKYYKKDELILKKYNINPSDENLEELKKYDNKI